jgi:sulfur carrier protein
LSIKGAIGAEMQITLPDGSRKEMAVHNARIEDVLKELGINPVEVIVARNGKIVTEEENAGSADELKIVRVVHGG